MLLVDLRPVEHPVVGLGQAKQSHGREAGLRRLDRQIASARKHVAARERAVGQLEAGVAEALVLDQAPDQLFARIDAVLELTLFVVLAGHDRQQLAALEEGQRRRHQQVLARDLDVERAREADVLDVLLGDEGDRDVEDVELVATHEVQEQIERALEHVERDRVAAAHVNTIGDRVGRRAPRASPSHLGPGLVSSLGPSLVSGLGPGLVSSLGPGLVSSLGPGLVSGLGIDRLVRLGHRRGQRTTAHAATAT
nr:hypothetical protein [Enhygromyxa salina]